MKYYVTADIHGFYTPFHKALTASGYFDETGEKKLDDHGHMFVDHDLYNHDGLTEDGIAEAFIEFAKKEGMSFFR